MVYAPHPLAVALTERLQSRPGSRILDFAAGSGRNGEALRRAGFAVIAIDDETAASEDSLGHVDEHFAAAISTHGLLHGNAAAIAARLRALARILEPGGLLYATFGSTRDSRFGRGERIDDSTYAPLQGTERGVPHAYFDRERLRALIETHFVPELLKEERVDDVAGRWAHPDRPLRDAVHWFVLARKR